MYVGVLLMVSGIFPPQIEFASSKARNKGLLARLLGSRTVNTFLELMQSVEGVELGELEPMTTVLVWTWNSLYRVVVAEGSDVLVQGGLLFPRPTPAHVDGAS